MDQGDQGACSRSNRPHESLYARSFGETLARRRAVGELGPAQDGARLIMSQAMLCWAQSPVIGSVPKQGCGGGIRPKNVAGQCNAWPHMHCEMEPSFERDAAGLKNPIRPFEAHKLNQLSSCLKMDRC